MKKVLLALTIVLGAAFIVRASTDEPYGVVVVNKLSYSSQTSSISPVTIASPVSDTDYLIQGYCPIIFTTSDDSNVACTLTWTDPDGYTESIDVADGGGFHGGGGQSPRSLRVKGGTNVQFSTTYNAGSTNNLYNASILVVKE